MVSSQRFAIDLARSTGRVLRRTRSEYRDAPVAKLKDLGDAAAQAHIAARLAEVFPADAVLSEEAADTTGRLAASRVWIIDPLDGTREYAEGRADWAVHIALWERDAGLTVGAVAIPDEDLVIASTPRERPPARRAGPLRIAVSRSRPPQIVHTVVGQLAERGVMAELVPMGSAGVKIASVVRGLTDAYLHGGGQYQWDSAAPVAVARSAGLHASRLDGSPLVYNDADTYLPDLLVCRSSYAAPLLETVAAHP